MHLRVVDVVESFSVHVFAVQPGARIMALARADASWVVYFNGNDFPPMGSCARYARPPRRKDVPQFYSAARPEQNQFAPAKTA